MKSFVRYRAMADLTFGDLYDQISAHNIVFLCMIIAININQSN